jgi:hypothetical protein
MDINIVLEEIKEFASECVWKYGKECIEAPDSIVIAYLKALMPERDFKIFLRFKKIMIEEFRKQAGKELEWLSS